MGILYEVDASGNVTGSGGIFTGTVYGLAFNTNVAAAALGLSGTSLTAVGTDASINVNIVPKGVGSVVMSSVNISGGRINNTPIGAGGASTGAFSTCTAGSLLLQDLDVSNTLTVFWNEDDAANRILHLAVNGANRSLTVGADVTLNQDVSSVSSVTFSGLTLTGFSGILSAAAGVVSAGAATLDQVLDGATYGRVRQSSLTANEVVKLTDGAGDDFTVLLNGADRSLSLTMDVQLDQNLRTVDDVAFATMQLGSNGTTGFLKLYSEQGATDYTATLYPSSSMTANSDFYLPSEQPAATYILNMTAAGVMGFDTSVYINNADPQIVNGLKTFTTFPLTPSAFPTADYETANKAYVDSVATGLTPKSSVRAATTSPLPACTYDGTPNFTLTGDAVGALADQDGVTLIATNRLLVKNQVAAEHNGIYEVTTVGDGGNPFVLTRTADSNTSAEVDHGTFVYVEEGDTLAGYQFIQVTDTPTLDTDPLVYSVLYAPLADTLQTITNRGATTTLTVTAGGLSNTKQVVESSIKNLTVLDTPYVVLAADRHIYCKTVGGAIEVDLPPATGSGRILSIGKRDNAVAYVTVKADTTGVADLINGQAIIELTSIYEDLTIQDCAANEWAIK